MIREVGDMLLTSYKKPLIYKSKGGVGTVTKKYININETRQGLIIESLNKGKPLLLFLHGGPGFSAYPVIKAHIKKCTPSITLHIAHISRNHIDFIKSFLRTF